MKAILIACLVSVSVSMAGAITISDPNISLSEQQKESISAWLNILVAVYDNDTSLIPDDPNEVLALETSENPRDLLAWEIFKMLRYALDPNSAPPDENIPVISNEPNMSAMLSVVISDPNINPLPVVSTIDTAKSSQEGQESQQAQMMASVQSTEQIEELSNPLGSRILESKTYRITTLPLEIEGHIVIPAGTKLIAPFDPNNNIIEVMPGGLLDMGKAASYSEPNYPDILPPVEIVSEDPNLMFEHNFVGIWIRRGANPSTCINNVIIKNCELGILADEALTRPICNVITFGCYNGIHLYAPNAIVDSEFWINGALFIELFPYPGIGIYIDLDGEAYPYPGVNINRTVTYGGDAGIYLKGCNPDPNLSDPNQVIPKMDVLNSCFALDFYFGIYKTAGSASIDVHYCAFGFNEWDTNFPMSFADCVGFLYDPFYTVGEEKKLYIAPWSEMTDAGSGMAEDGTGTCPYQPDIGQMDIGCHFPIGVSGSFGIPSSPADFNWDGIVDELDLQLMNDCMGAIADPNIVKIDTNYDSRVNLPDFGLFAVDYGYDPNNPDNNDPNSERSDFNGDHRVDLADLEVLAQNWLTLVFNEYRICGLCNIGTNDPNEPSTSHIIDSKDYDALMADWYKRFFSDPNISIAQSASQLTVAVGNTDMVWKISAFLDDEPIGQWISGELGSTAFDVDLTRYGPGSHRVKIVRNIGSGLEINERIITDPNSTGLYFADIPDTFEPNEPYSIRGFNLNDGELNFKIGNVRNETIYDVNVPPGAVDLKIPPEVFDANQICTLRLEGNSYLSEGFGVSAADESQEEKYEKILEQEFDREKYRGRGVRFLVLLSDRKATATYKDAIFAAIAAIEKRVPNYPYIVLTGTNVNHENLKFALYNTYGPKIVVFFGHANSHIGAELINGENVGGVQRTTFQCYEKREGYIWDSYDNVGIVSYTRNTNPVAELLPDSLDNVVIDFTRLLEGSTSRDFVPIDQMYVFGCFSAAYDDMAAAQGCGGLHDNTYADMIYCGFTEAPLQNNGKWIFIPEMQDLGTLIVQGLVIFFQQLGDGKRVDQARQYLESGYVDRGIKQAIFQKAGLKFYGRGYGNVRFGLWGATE